MVLGLVRRWNLEFGQNRRRDCSGAVLEPARACSVRFAGLRSARAKGLILLSFGASSSWPRGRLPRVAGILLFYGNWEVGAHRQDDGSAFRMPFLSLHARFDLMHAHSSLDSAHPSPDRPPARAGGSRRTPDLAQVAAGVDPLAIAPADFSERSAAGVPIPAPCARNQLDILLLEPHALTGQLAAAALRAARWRVHLCRDADEAISVAARCAPRLIVSEAYLPGFSVDRFLDALRTAWGSEAPHYLVLASIPAAAREALESVGVDAVVHKPFQPSELVQACRALLVARERDEVEP